MTTKPTSGLTLGLVYTDSITGFSGVATSRVEYLTGCVHIGLQPRVDKDGKVPEAQYFDESRLDSTKESPGGPEDAPSDHRTHF